MTIHHVTSSVRVRIEALLGEAASAMFSMRCGRPGATRRLTDVAYDVTVAGSGFGGNLQLKGDASSCKSQCYSNEVDRDPDLLRDTVPREDRHGC